MEKLILSKIAKALLHVFFWTVVLFFYISYFGFKSGNFDYVVYFSLFLMPITIATTYVFIYKLIPDYLLTKRYFLFAVYSFYSFIISAYLIVLSVFLGLLYLTSFQQKDMAPVSTNLLFVATGVYLVVIVVSAFKSLKLNLKHSNATKSLEKRVLEVQLKLKEQELKYLKMQIHPHFLFNTLNTMYGFALKKADETPEMILKLSNLLDYLLYKVDQPFVLLTDDIGHIKDYLELEKMRFNDTLEVEFKTENISKDLKISPMLLIPFIENSFKHGAIVNGKLNIQIRLKAAKGELYFSIVNTNKLSEINPNGIGLHNIKKRLELLYKNKYNLRIKHTKDFYKVELFLKLN